MIENIQDLLGVGFPVGGGVHDAAGAQEGRQEGGEGRCDETPLAVALFGPGIGEPYVEGIEASGGDGFLEYIHRVAFDDKDVGDSALFDPPQEFADAGAVHFNGGQGPVGVGLGGSAGGIAHAEADFQDAAGGMGEAGGPVQRGIGRDNQAGGMGLVGPPLGIGHARGADYVAFDAGVTAVGGIFHRGSLLKERAQALFDKFGLFFEADFAGFHQQCVGARRIELDPAGGRNHQTHYLLG